MNNETEKVEEIRLVDLTPALEFVCWTVVVLALFLRLINGPAVTNDQWWIQVFLFVGAIMGGCSLRLHQVLSHCKSK